jgi:ribosomal protein L35AE/L33A
MKSIHCNKHIYEKGTITGFKRSLRHQNISQVRIKIKNKKIIEKNKLYLGKKIFCISKNRPLGKIKIVWGKIISLHGRSGCFIAKFKKNISPNYISSNIYITMIPSKRH